MIMDSLTLAHLSDSAALSLELNEGNTMSLTTLKPPMISLIGSVIPSDGQLLAFDAASGKAVFIDPPEVAPAADLTVAATSEYCPNYTTVVAADGTITLPGFDLTSLFHLGRVVAMESNTALGKVRAVVTATSFVGGSTLLTLNPAPSVGYTNLCLNTGEASWVAMSADPFLGSSIDCLVSGLAGGRSVYMIGGKLGRLAISSDAGISWANLASPPWGTSHVFSIKYSATLEAFFLSTSDNVIYRSYDEGATWESITVGHTLHSSPHFGLSTTDIVTAGLNNIYVADPDKLGTSSWLVRTLGDNMQDAPLFFDIFDGALVTFRMTAYGLRRFYLPQLHHNDAYHEVSSIVGDFYSFNDLAQKPNGVHIAVFDSGLVFRLTTHHQNSLWLVSETDFGVYGIKSIAYSPLHDRFVLAGENSSLAYSANSDGATFVSLGSGFNPLSTITSVIWDDSDGLFMAVNNQGQICRSSNGIV